MQFRCARRQKVWRIKIVFSGDPDHGKQRVTPRISKRRALAVRRRRLS
jgi:hypothetical protein